MLTHQCHELTQHNVGGVFIQIPRWFVRQYQFWPVRKRPRDGNPLLFAAGEFGRPVVEPLRKPKLREQMGRAFDRILWRCIGNQLGKDDIFKRIEIGQQVMKLIHEAEFLPAYLGLTINACRADFFSIQFDGTRKAALKQTDRLKHG